MLVKAFTEYSTVEALKVLSSFIGSKQIACSKLAGKLGMGRTN